MTSANFTDTKGSDMKPQQDSEETLCSQVSRLDTAGSREETQDSHSAASHGDGKSRIQTQGSAAASATIISTPGAALYVGNLSPSVTDNILYETFSPVGRVVTVRVCRDTLTGKSLGYGYVNYADREDAETALELLKYAWIDGRQCRVMWSIRDPTKRRQGAGNVFVKNLEASINNRELHDTFEQFGTILSCMVSCTDKGVSKGYGFVHFETEKEADEAIKYVNGKMLGKKRVHVTKHVSAIQRQGMLEEAKKRFTNIYIKGIDETVDEARLRELFTHYGDIQSARIERTSAGASKKFGFINFHDHSSALQAVGEMNGSVVDGCELFVCRAMSKEERLEHLNKEYERRRLEMHQKHKDTNVYVRNMPPEIDERTLEQLFSQYGKILSTRVMRTDEGISRCFGFVCFETSEHAKNAIVGQNGKMLNGKPLYAGLAELKEDRLERIAEEHRLKAQRELTERGAVLPSGKTTGAGWGAEERRVMKPANKPAAKKDGSRYLKRSDVTRSTAEDYKDNGDLYIRRRPAFTVSELAKMSDSERHACIGRDILGRVREFVSDEKKAIEITKRFMVRENEELLDLVEIEEQQLRVQVEKIIEQLEKENCPAESK